MNKIEALFENKKPFGGFVAAGDPDLEASEAVMLKMVEAGCDFLLVEIPFSDPIAESPIVQSANLRALQAGALTREVLDIIKSVNEKTGVPIMIKSYLNVLFKYGYERFAREASECGIIAIVVPDMPFEEKSEIAEETKKHGVTVISEISTKSGEKRIEKIAKGSEGFIFNFLFKADMASPESVKASVDAVKKHSDLPVILSLDATTKESVDKFLAIADGIVTDTETVRIIEKYKADAPEKVAEFIKSIK